MGLKTIKKEVTTVAVQDVPGFELELDVDFANKTITEQFEFLRAAMRDVARAHVDAGLAKYGEIEALVDRIDSVSADDWYTSSPSFVLVSGLSP